MDMITYAKAKKYADKVAATGGNTELIESLVTEEVTKVVTQSDWEQNDEAALNFIKNKPFGETNEFEYVPLIENLALATSTAGVLDKVPTIEYNNSYKIIVDEKEYFCEPVEAPFFGSSIPAIGNIAPINGGEWDPTQPPLYIGCVSNFWMVGTTNRENGDTTPYTVSVFKKQQIVKRLDLKYIQDIAGSQCKVQDYVYEGETYNSYDGAEIFNSEDNVAIGFYSHAEGKETLALGDYSHAEGSYCKTIGYGSHAEGSGARANGNYSHAEGSSTISSGDASHAEGSGSVSSAQASHAEGYYTIANTPFLHVQGSYNIPEENPTLFVWGIWNTIGNKTYDGETVIYIYDKHPSLNKTTGIITTGEVREGTIKELKAEDYFSFENEANSEVESFYCAREFIGTETDSETGGTLYTWYLVMYKASPRNFDFCKYLHIVGNGDSDKRSNAHTLEANGTAWYQGDVYVGSTSGVNRDEGSKKLATEDYVNSSVSTAKNELLNGAGAAYDTLKELGELIDENQDAIKALETIAASKPDWNQNDETALGFIKNKPFGDTGKYDFIPVFENGVFGRLASYVYFGDDLAVDFVLGDFYKVVFNGVDYICEAKKEGQFTYLGNPVGYLETFADVFMTDLSKLDWGTEEPFCIFNGTMIVKDASPDPKVSLYKRKSIVNMLDRKYIDYIPGEKTGLKKIIFNDTEYICGDNSEVFNDYINNKAIGEYSHAEGFDTIASGAYSHAEAFKTIAEGAYAHAEGSQTKATGLSSHAEGDEVEAKGSYSHAEGHFTTSLGLRSHVEGMHTIATGAMSHVQGKYNLVDDSVPRYAESFISPVDWPEYDGEKIVYLLNQDRPKFNNQTGQFTITDEITEIAYKNLQKGNLFLFTRPENNTIYEYYEIVDFVSSREDGNTTLYKFSYGKCVRNEKTGGEGAKLAHIVGNGTEENARSNAHTLDWEGNAWFAGDVYVGSTSGTNKDEGSKKLATEEQVVGKKTEGTVVTFEDKEHTCAAGAEIFNDLANNKAIGQYSHAEGSGTVAMGLYAHAEGMRSQAIGNFSHAENYSQAPGGYAHSEGSQTVAKGIMSHAEGWMSETSADYSHAEGHGTIAASSRSHVQGMYNEIDSHKGRTVYAVASLGLGGNKTFNSTDIVYVLEGDIQLNFFTGEITADSLKETLVKDLQVEDNFATVNTNITQYYALMNIKEVNDTQFTGYCVTMTGVPHENLGKYAHIVGNGGSAHARSNAHTLDWDGNAWYQGDVECSSIILRSSTEGSTKRFRLTIDDSGNLTTTEITE